ncbi:MAG: nitrilase-related carbon-nitrogen hydrolase, partial [Tepidisphaeraceae bacterium]
MPRTVKCGLVQAANVAPIDAPADQIKKINTDHQMKFIEQAGKSGVQILCLQEVFNTPYFCAEQKTRWYETTEKIPDGITTKLMQEVAKKYSMVMIVPIYEVEISGIYY